MTTFSHEPFFNKAASPEFMGSGHDKRKLGISPLLLTQKDDRGYIFSGSSSLNLLQKYCINIYQDQGLLDQKYLMQEVLFKM